MWGGELRSGRPSSGVSSRVRPSGCEHSLGYFYWFWIRGNVAHSPARLCTTAQRAAASMAMLSGSWNCNPGACSQEKTKRIQMKKHFATNLIVVILILLMAMPAFAQDGRQGTPTVPDRPTTISAEEIAKEMNASPMRVKAYASNSASPSARLVRRVVLPQSSACSASPNLLQMA